MMHATVRNATARFLFTTHEPLLRCATVASRAQDACRDLPEGSTPEARALGSASGASIGVCPLAAESSGNSAQPASHDSARCKLDLLADEHLRRIRCLSTFLAGVSIPLKLAMPSLDSNGSAVSVMRRSRRCCHRGSSSLSWRSSSTSRLTRMPSLASQSTEDSGSSSRSQSPPPAARDFWIRPFSSRGTAQ